MITTNILATKYTYKVTIIMNLIGNSTPKPHFRQRKRENQPIRCNIFIFL